MRKGCKEVKNRNGKSVELFQKIKTILSKFLKATLEIKDTVVKFRVARVSDYERIRTNKNFVWLSYEILSKCKYDAAPVSLGDFS